MESDDPKNATDQLMKINKISILEWINLYRPINN